MTLVSPHYFWAIHAYLLMENDLNKKHLLENFPYFYFCHPLNSFRGTENIVTASPSKQALVVLMNSSHYLLRSLVYILIISALNKKYRMIESDG